MNSNLVSCPIPVGALLLLALHLSAGDVPPALQFVESKVVDGLRAGVTDEVGSTNTPISRRLCFSIWTVANGFRRVAFPTDPQYQYAVELFDTNNVALPKTALGKEAGTKFLKFDPTAFDKGIKVQQILADEKGRPAGMLILFRPSDLFVVHRPGIYNLRIRLQILAFPKKGTSRVHAPPQLIRFAPIDYPLLAPEVKAPAK